MRVVAPPQARHFNEIVDIDTFHGAVVPDYRDDAVAPTLVMNGTAPALGATVAARLRQPNGRVLSHPVRRMQHASEFGRCGFDAVGGRPAGPTQPLDEYSKP